MSAEKFYTRDYSLEIKPVAIERESESCVWINISGRSSRSNKKSSYDRYHDTWEEAHAYLVARCQRSVDALKEQLQKARTSLGQVESLKKPAEAGA
jgi:hypothetical protein